MEKIRLQKILSDSGIASRRGAEALISGGKVKVNGHPASVGDKADPERDHITVSGKRLPAREKKLYIMLNKPRGTVTTMNDERGRKCVSALVENTGSRVYPVGRLDKDSEGLLLLTNDGNFANAITHPTGHIPKHYRVTLRPDLTDEQAEQFRNGMLLKGEKPGQLDYFTAPAELTELSRETLTDNDGRVLGQRIVAEVVLREGRNRQIRRMFAKMGVEVIRLRRSAIGGLKLGMLPSGKWRNLEPEEVAALLKASGIETGKAARSGNRKKEVNRHAGVSARK